MGLKRGEIVPVELRRLVFSEQEVQAALINYALRSDMKLPNANIQSLQVFKKDGISAILKFPPNAEGKAREVNFSEAHLAAAIILYCRVQDIPVPRDARKVLAHNKNSVSMSMEVHYGEQAQGAAEAAREAVKDAGSE
jgi:hypothetical protein|tara:strand:+ start:5303 stop:5716 length:414 start_codon:yes stop_codon:yes gene_type:complete